MTKKHLFDIINYVIESTFEYSPGYEFFPNEIDLKLFYDIYLRFISSFEKSEKHSYFLESEEGKNELKRLKSFKYFLDLVILDNILWFVFALIYVDYEKYIGKTGFDYFRHAHDRVLYLEQIKNSVKNSDIEISL